MERVTPVARVKTQFPGTQVSTENEDHDQGEPAAHLHHPVDLGCPGEGDGAGGGGSTDARGSPARSRWRMPGSTRSKTTNMRKGMAGSSSGVQMLVGEK